MVMVAIVLQARPTSAKEGKGLVNCIYKPWPAALYSVSTCLIGILWYLIVSWCLIVCYDVSWFHGVSWCLNVSWWCLMMSHQVSRCLIVSHCVLWCPLSHNVSHCLIISQCLIISHGASCCFRSSHDMSQCSSQVVPTLVQCSRVK